MLYRSAQASVSNSCSPIGHVPRRQVFMDTSVSFKLAKGGRLVSWSVARERNSGAGIFRRRPNFKSTSMGICSPAYKLMGVRKITFSAALRPCSSGATDVNPVHPQAVVISFCLYRQAHWQVQMCRAGIASCAQIAAVRTCMLQLHRDLAVD